MAQNRVYLCTLLCTEWVYIYGVLPHWRKIQVIVMMQHWC